MNSEMEMARFVTRTGFSDLPREAVEAAKLNILDTLSCALGGSQTPGCREVVELANELGADGHSSILVYSGKVHPSSAALANATMAHALDFDDTHDIAGFHAGATAVPGSLAIAEHVGKVSGKDLITAVTLGIDVSSRMSLATKPFFGWMFTSLYGSFGVAASASKLLGLDEEGIMNAWGIALDQAAGSNQWVYDGALTKRLQPGFGAQGGILSALLAQKGVTGPKRSMEGEWGIFNLYQRGEYDPTLLTTKLGERFEVVNLSYKPYPCCRLIHTAIDAALTLVREHDITPDQIEEVAVEVGERAHHVCGSGAVKYKPKTIVDAQFSIPYVVAVALAQRKVNIDDFTEKAIKRPKMLELAAKLRVNIDAGITKAYGRRISASRLKIRTKQGKGYSIRRDFAKGHPQNPMAKGDFKEKLQDCAAHAAMPLPKGVPKKLMELIEGLEEVKDVAQITRLLTPPG